MTGSFSIQRILEKDDKSRQIDHGSAKYHDAVVTSARYPITILHGRKFISYYNEPNTRYYEPITRYVRLSSGEELNECGSDSERNEVIRYGCSCSDCRNSSIRKLRTLVENKNTPSNWFYHGTSRSPHRYENAEEQTVPQVNHSSINYCRCCDSLTSCSKNSNDHSHIAQDLTRAYFTEIDRKYVYKSEPEQFLVPSVSPLAQRKDSDVNKTQNVDQIPSPDSDESRESSLSPEPESGVKYYCQKCDRNFRWFGNFQKHMLTHGEQERHSLFVSSDTPEEDFVRREGNSFVCKLCLKSFSRYSGLRSHIRMHRGKRPYKCTECSYSFTTNRALKIHQRIHSGEKPYECKQCDKKFTRKDELQAHVYVHNGEKPYKCHHCGAAFVRHGHLRRHLYTHSDNKPYKCKLCTKSFTQFRNLQTHMYTHTGERPYICKFCSKGFTQKGTLQAHERVHTGEKPFSCDHCHKKFITSSHLRWHVRKHHAQEKVDI